MRRPILSIAAIYVLFAALPLQASLIYVSNSGGNAIDEVDTASGNVSTFVSGIPDPGAMAVDSAGDLYVALQGAHSNQSNSIDKITPAGVVTTFLTGPVGYSFLGLALDSSGHVYATGLHAAGTYIASIFEYNSLGSTLNTFNYTSFAPEEPAAMAFDASGHLFTTDYSGNALYQISSTGAATKVMSLGVNPDGMAFDKSGNLFVALNSTEAIDEITPSDSVSVFEPNIPGASALSFDSAGDLFVLNGYSPESGFHGSITEITPLGAVTTVASGFNNPAGIVVVPELSSGTALMVCLLLFLVPRRRSTDPSTR